MFFGSFYRDGLSKLPKVAVLSDNREFVFPAFLSNNMWWLENTLERKAAWM